MKASELKMLQAPLKESYQRNPETACITLKAEGKIGEGISCKVDTGRALVEAECWLVRAICSWKRLLPVRG